MSEENFKEIINKRFNEEMEIEYALKFNFDEIVKKVINVKYKDDELKCLQKIIEQQQKEIEKLINEKNIYKELTKHAQDDVKIWKDLYYKQQKETRSKYVGN